MSTQHPKVQDFALLLRSGPQKGRPGRNTRETRVIRHFLTGCSVCREQLRAAGWEESRLDRLFKRPLQELTPVELARLEALQSYDYDGAFAGAARSLAAFLAPEPAPPRPVEDLLAALQADLPATPESLAHPAVVRRLIEDSHAARYEDPRSMLRLARLAQSAADACTEEAAGGPERLADLRARAWGSYGNALRVHGDLARAEEVLTAAQRFFAAGTGDPPLHARLLEQWASLRTFQGHFQKAVELDAEAGAIYAELGETYNLASTMVQRAIAALYAGETESAVRTLNRAIPCIAPEENPHLLLAACHNLMRGYIDLDRPEQALALYFEARELYQEFEAHTTIQLRARWQEGQLLRDLGHLGAAEAALSEARQGFLERGIAIEVALVSLDLASVYVRAGKVEELQRTVSEAVPIFRALHAGREAIAALLQLQQAAGQEQRALELIRAIDARLSVLTRPAENG
jgi:tetratricopeptide (TPR) repeat protein